MNVNRGRSAFLLGLVASALVACGGDDVSGPDVSEPEPDPVEAVVVTSPIENVMAVGRSVELDAVARDASGEPMAGTSFEWRSSEESVATVDGDGTVEGSSTGVATITAEAEGVSGDLEMRVVAADLATLATLLDDPYTRQLDASLTGGPADAVQAALDECSTALDAGHVLALDGCLRQIRAETATEPTNRALLAVLSIVAQRAGLLLDL